MFAYTGGLQGVQGEPGEPGVPGDLTFYDRGDAGGADLAFASMTADFAYHDWNLSSIIPAGTKLVLLRVWRMKSSSADDEIKFRPKGGEDEYNVTFVSVNLSAEDTYETCLVVPDADRIIQYALRSTFSDANFIVGGWFK